MASEGADEKTRGPVGAGDTSSADSAGNAVDVTGRSVAGDARATGRMVDAQGASGGRGASGGQDAPEGRGASGGRDASGGRGARGSADVVADVVTASETASEAIAEAARPANGESVRIDSWIWSVRLVKTRSLGAAACRGGHVRVNGERVKPAHSVRVGDEVRLRHAGHERIVVVKRLIRKRVGAPVAVECYVDNSPPSLPREAVAPVGIRDRGTGRPTKRDRREMEHLRGLGAPGGPHHTR